MSHPSKKRNFGVRQDKEYEPPARYVRPEGSGEPVESTHTNPPGSGRTVSPKRWEELQEEKRRERFRRLD